MLLAARYGLSVVVARPRPDTLIGSIRPKDVLVSWCLEREFSLCLSQLATCGNTVVFDFDKRDRIRRRSVRHPHDEIGKTTTGR